MRSRLQLAAVVFVLALFGLAGCGDDDSLKADAGDDFSVDVGAAPAFDGCSSSGDIVNYRWVIRETPADMSDDDDKPLRDSSADCSFTLEESMAVNDIGDWVIELTVTDAGGDSSSDAVTVTVTG